MICAGVWPDLNNIFHVRITCILYINKLLSRLMFWNGFLIIHDLSYCPWICFVNIDRICYFYITYHMNSCQIFFCVWHYGCSILRKGTIMTYFFIVFLLAWNMGGLDFSLFCHHLTWIQYCRLFLKIIAFKFGDKVNERIVLWSTTDNSIYNTNDTHTLLTFQLHIFNHIGGVKM